jgi:hypothetical protein
VRRSLRHRSGRVTAARGCSSHHRNRDCRSRHSSIQRGPGWLPLPLPRAGPTRPRRVSPRVRRAVLDLPRSRAGQLVCGQPQTARPPMASDAASPRFCTVDWERLRLATPTERRAASEGVVHPVVPHSAARGSSRDICAAAASSVSSAARYEAKAKTRESPSDRRKSSQRNETMRAAARHLTWAMPNRLAR